jgi:predicted XRE-type DNA-binding protein
MIQSEKVKQWRTEVHAAVVEAIKSSGRSQKDIAQELGIGQPKVSEIVRRPAANFRLEYLLTLAEKLGVGVRFNTKLVPPSFEPRVT